MAIGTTEIVLIILAIIVLFGPSKIPELARSLGMATGEFKKAKNETEMEFREVEKSVKEGYSIEENSFKIKHMAGDLGIVTKGKTDEQLLDEIKKKMPTVVKSNN